MTESTPPDPLVCTTYARVVGCIVELGRRRYGYDHAELAEAMKMGPGGEERLRGIEAGTIDPTMEELGVLGKVPFLGTSGLFVNADEICAVLADANVPVFRRRTALADWAASTGGAEWTDHVYDLFAKYATKLNYEWHSPLEHISQLRWMIRKFPDLVVRS